MRSRRTGGPRPGFDVFSTHFLVDQSRDGTSASHAINSAPRCGPRSQREIRGHDSFSPWRCLVRSAVDNRASDFDDDRPPDARPDHALPVLLTVDEAATLLRTTRRAIYAMIERRQLPGVIRIRRRVLFRARRPATLAGPEARAIAGGVNGDERHTTTVSKRGLGSGHHDPASGRQSISRAETRVPLLEIGGASMGAGP